MTFAFRPVHELATDIAARRLTLVDLVDEYLARIERLDPRLRAFVSVNASHARLAAESADKAIRAGHAVGPLYGIPIAVKDLVEIEDKVAMGGSAAWRHRIAPRTATLMHKLMAAGMINLGKTHTVEFAYGGWGTNQHLGTPWNPWDDGAHRAPGGSSSGSGVAVAARMAPWAIGTDTGGSVRIPAAWNGITGLKTTIGGISAFGVLPLSPTLDTPAVFTGWVNFLDLCALAVPSGFTANGLPTSLQIVCRAHAAPMALRIGHAYQAAHDWHLRVPPMAG
jgi:aspartyl-tRNA(Asn)/glutamyl-tRNA(Gln) amidotransferase subunit A